jgi:cupin 2 domain-containing protein
MQKFLNSTGNIFADIIPDQSKELFESIIETDGIKIERIVSSGQTTPAGDLYNQPKEEWVLVLSGSAIVSFVESGELFTLSAGDYLRIPARTKHRVEHTSTDETTLWLAIHY